MKYITVFLLLFTINVSAQTVYKTPSGSKYHLSGCRMVKNVYSVLSIQTALSEGLLPCKICKPPFSNAMGIVLKPKKILESIHRTVVLPLLKVETDAREIQGLAIISVSSISLKICQNFIRIALNYDIIS
ncbi:MAG: hypothetical protein L6264_06080 [Weeksellaceae bacterium]|nr:hypothetical protein [Bacteroidota bacterium]MCG2780500.1 hypothetical protein [Weeksellaceae bacterium]